MSEVSVVKEILASDVFIVLETFGGAKYAMPLMLEDGMAKVFYGRDEAEKVAAEECQYGIVVPVTENAI
jgi:hypothetical protein